MSRVMLTGQWSEPMTAGWISAAVILSLSEAETRK